MKADGFTSEMLLDGDSAALESFMCSNEIQAGVKHDAFVFSSSIPMAYPLNLNFMSTPGMNAFDSSPCTT